MKSAFVPEHFPSLIVSQEFCILLISFCFLQFLSWRVGQNAAWIKLKPESLYGYMACALRLFAHSSSSPKETLHKGVVDYFTDRPLTHLRLTINLISTFCTQFQLFVLFGINWRALSQWTCWDERRNISNGMSLNQNVRCTEQTFIQDWAKTGREDEMSPKLN